MSKIFDIFGRYECIASIVIYSGSVRMNLHYFDMSYSMASWGFNKIKQYQPTELANLLFEYLHMPVDEPLGELKKMPWITLRALEWCFELAIHNGKRTPTKRDAYKIVNSLYGIQYLASQLQTTEPYQTPLRAILIPQLRFQRSDPYQYFWTPS